jgi:hypothetical protein
MVQYKVVVAVEGMSLPNGRIETQFSYENDTAPCTVEDAAAGLFEKASEKVVPLGLVAGLPEGWQAYADGFNVVHLCNGLGDFEGRKHHILSKNIPIIFPDGLEVTCRPVVDPPPHVRDTRGLLLRVVHFFRRARCHRCFYYDIGSAQEWRDRVTHVFGGTSGGDDGLLVERMWHNVMQMESDRYRIPDIPRGMFGYCAKKGVGLHGMLRACRHYRLRKEENR